MEQIIFFAFLVLFPFGQIVKIGIINPIDVVVVIGALYAIFKKLPKPEHFKYIDAFLLVLGFTWVIGFLQDFRGLPAQAGIYGLLYLFRLAAYFYFSILVFNSQISNLLLKSLLSLSLVSALAGWIQYFWIPDLTTFTIWGWDDHLYRMAGTFLDPGFLGIILVLGAILALHKKYYLAFGFLAFSILFTYSRASYLALIVPLFFMFKKLKYYLLFVICLLIIGISLPRVAGEGVRLERTASINQRFENYSQTFEIFKNNPLFGVGFNNICLAKNSDFSSHSCSGADSSLLFLLATTGVIGFISFAYMVYRIWYVVRQYTTYNILYTSFFAIMIHSLFTNSLFYPWVMGWMAILLGSKKDR